MLSELLAINVNSIGAAIADTRQLLAEHGHTITPTTLRFRTAADLREFVITNQPEPTRSQIPDLLADPALTGLPRAELRALTRQVANLQEARNEGYRYRRRGGERLPGSRGGIFRQKITNDERVLAALLYQRKLCSQDVLADLFHVSRRTIGNVIREVGPILAQHGHNPTPAPTKFTTATALLESLTGKPATTRTS